MNEDWQHMVVPLHDPFCWYVARNLDGTSESLISIASSSNVSDVTNTHLIEKHSFLI